MLHKKFEMEHKQFQVYFVQSEWNFWDLGFTFNFKHVPFYAPASVDLISILETFSHLLQICDEKLQRH